MKVVEGVYWVGTKDPGLRDFHSYTPYLGSSYNAYLVVGSKGAALVDTTKPHLFGDLVARVEKVIGDFSKLNYIVVNHNEPDHMGALAEAMRLAPGATVLATKKGVEGALKFFGSLPSERFQAVKAGDAVDLGGLSLQFLPTPMVHWPESMATLVPERRLALTNDAFGQHYTGEALFDDEAPREIILRELKKYYASIVDMVNPGPVKKAVAALKEFGPEIIAPSHGVIWRKGVKEVLDLYERWASGETLPKVTLIYDTMYGSTERMAQAVARWLEEEGLPVVVYKASVTDPQEYLADLLDSAGVAVGAPTMHNGIYPPVAFALEYLRHMSKRRRFGLGFGSYGWGGGAERDLSRYFSDAGIEEVGFWKAKFRPSTEDLEAGRALVREFAEKVKGGA